jgi:hypothetical protein
MTAMRATMVLHLIYATTLYQKSSVLSVRRVKLFVVGRSNISCKESCGEIVEDVSLLPVLKIWQTEVRAATWPDAPVSLPQCVCGRRCSLLFSDLPTMP